MRNRVGDRDFGGNVTTKRPRHQILTMRAASSTLRFSAPIHDEAITFAMRPYQRPIILIMWWNCSLLLPPSKKSIPNTLLHFWLHRRLLSSPPPTTKICQPLLHLPAHPLIYVLNARRTYLGLPLWAFSSHNYARNIGYEIKMFILDIRQHWPQLRHVQCNTSHSKTIQATISNIIMYYRLE